MASLSDLPSPGLPGRALPIGRAPLVGRETEWRALTLALERARTTTELVFVAGEPGIGKTRLLAELARAATGFLVVRGGAYERQGQPPYVLFVEVLRSYLDQSRLDLAGTERATAAGLLGPLGRLLPEIVAEHEQQSPLSPIDRD